MSRPATTAGALIGVVAFLALAGGGCGYSTSSLMPAGIDSISVAMASNDTFYRRDEVVFTQYLTAAILHKTQVQIRNPREAQAELSARILSLPRVTLVEGRATEIQDEGMIGAVEVTLRERGTGRVITQFQLRRRAEAIYARGDTLDQERDRVMHELAEDTVVELQKNTLLIERHRDGSPIRRPVESRAESPSADSAPASRGG